MDATQFREELDRRLVLIEKPDYDDPAAADLPRRDLLVLLIASVVLVGALFWWGYPW